MVKLFDTKKEKRKKKWPVYVYNKLLENSFLFRTMNRTKEEIGKKEKKVDFTFQLSTITFSVEETMT